MTSVHQQGLTVACLTDRAHPTRLAVLKAFLDDSGMFAPIEDSPALIRRLMVEPVDQTFEGSLCTLAVVSELWHTSQDDSKSTLGSLLQQYVPISRSRSDETTCLAYERLTASLLSRPIRPAQVVENYFLMMKQANVILFARVGRQFLSKAAEDSLVAALAQPWMVMSEFSKQQAAWDWVPPVYVVSEATRAATQACLKLLRGNAAFRLENLKAPLRALATWSQNLSEVDALNLAPNVLSLLLIFQRIATSESVSEDVRSVTAAARSPLWSRLTGKIGAELIRAIGSQECTDLVEVQIEPYQELLHLLTDVPLACPAHDALYAIFELFPSSSLWLLTTDVLYARVLSTMTTVVLSSSSLALCEDVFFRYCFHEHPLCRLFALDIWCSVLRSAPQLAERYISVIVDLTRAMQSSIIYQEGQSCLSSTRERVRRDLQDIISALIYSMPLDSQPIIPSRLLQNCMDETWALYALDMLPVRALARPHPNFLLQTQRLFTFALKICCNGAIGIANILAFRALRQFLAEPSLAAQLKPEMQATVVQLGIKMATRCLCDQGASGVTVSRDWRLLETALNASASGPHLLEIKHINELVAALTRGKQGSCTDASHKVTLARFFGYIGRLVSVDVGSRIAQVLDDLANDEHWAVAATAVLAANAIASGVNIGPSRTLSQFYSAAAGQLDIFTTMQDACCALEASGKNIPLSEVQSNVTSLCYRLDCLLGSVSIAEDRLFALIVEAKAKLEAVVKQIDRAD